MAERKAFPLRVDPGLWSAVERCATANLRSANAEVECLLYYAISWAEPWPDAVYDDDTHNLVVAFQRCANALGAGLVVDGRVGNNTRPHLEWWAGHSEYIC